MSTRKRYTPEEDEAIFKAIQETPHNIKKCFMMLSLELEREPKSISNRWYNYLSNPESKHYMGTASFLIGRRTISINRKLDYESMKTHPVKVKVSIWKSIWNKIKSIIK